MKNEIKVTVIIPVYNKENLLKRCLDSIEAQSYPYFEVVVVDDGSKDNSGEICDSYREKDSRFRVYHNENQGPGASRNFGIEQAKGEYITFVDADDRIHPDYLKSLLDASLNGKYDFVVGNYEIVTLENVHYPSGFNIPSRTGNIYDDYYNLNFLLFTPWGKLYRTNVIKENHILFPINMRTAEDQVFNYQYYDYIHQYSYIDLPIYLYTRGNENSLSSMKEKQTFSDELVNLRLKKDFCKRHGVQNAGKILLMQIYFIIVRYYFMGAKNMNFSQYLWEDYEGDTYKEKIKIYFIKRKWYRFFISWETFKEGMRSILRKIRS